ncbi:hypothetical protein K435DRAFT_63774 [Dendrothele bispora CBS 962.96]|uniref:Uncharacterized protein n=1 Tax=Dendrothele bispora (strain CBS 962.96) TaxID=1314807 RepID=A0A4S8KR52_DENBC|nr:hypothetical protein K435DRAFT_63774 [Dendrothele bispora CBS 962.96]
MDGLRDREQAIKATKLRDFGKRPRNMLARAGEGDRAIKTKMPKHLFEKLGRRADGESTSLSWNKEPRWQASNFAGLLDGILVSVLISSMVHAPKYVRCCKRSEACVAAAFVNL